MRSIIYVLRSFLLPRARMNRERRGALNDERELLLKLDCHVASAFALARERVMGLHIVEHSTAPLLPHRTSGTLRQEPVHPSGPLVRCTLLASPVDD